MRKLRFTKVKQHDHSILCINYSCRLTFLLPSLAWQLPKGRHSIFTSTSPRPGQAHRRRSMSTAGLSTVTTDKWQSCTRTRPDTMAHALVTQLPFVSPGFLAASSPHHPLKTPSHFPDHEEPTLTPTLGLSHTHTCT